MRVGMESTASTGESGRRPSWTRVGVMASALLLAPGLAAPPAFNHVDYQGEEDLLPFVA